MAPSEQTTADRLTRLEHDQRDHAGNIGALSESVGALTMSEAIRKNEEKHLDQRLNRIEQQLTGIFKLGWWLLAAFGASAVALIANFAWHGGFVVP